MSMMIRIINDMIRDKERNNFDCGRVIVFCDLDLSFSKKEYKDECELKLIMVLEVDKSVKNCKRIRNPS